MSLEESRVLVTGATGFIGSHLARRLVSEGADVTILVEPGVDFYSLENAEDKVKKVTADLREYPPVEKIIKNTKPEKIFHLAAFTNVGRDLENMKLANDVNVKGTINLLRASLAAAPELECFINTGTCEEYGNNPAPFKEDMLPQPVSPYSASKSAAWVFCEYFHKTHGLPVVTLRPFLTYGPYQRTNRLVTKLIVACILGEDFPMSGGKQRRELNHVDDIIEGFVMASECKRAIGETINLGNGMPYTLKEIAQKIVKITDAKINLGLGELPYRENEIWHLFCDNIKARGILGWRAKVSLYEGLKSTIDWYRNVHKTNSQLFNKLIIK